MVPILTKTKLTCICFTATLLSKAQGKECYLDFRVQYNQIGKGRAI